MRYLPMLLVCVLAVAGCPKAHNTTTPSPRRLRPTTGPASQRPPEIVVMVNGKPIYIDELHRPLVEAYGLKTAQMLILDALVNEEAAKRNIALSGKDVDNEIERALEGIFRGKVKPDQRDRLLDQLLEERGVTRVQWLTAMRRHALLRKMLLPGIKVPDQLIKAEFARVHGDKVRASHIQLPSISEAQKIIDLLKQGQDFGQLARRFSTDMRTARDGGKLAVFSRQEATVARAMRDVAFAMKAGQTSGLVQVGTSFHIIRLHEVIISAKVDFETVKEELRLQVRERLLDRERTKLLLDLRQRAKVTFINPVLRRKARGG